MLQKISYNIKNKAPPNPIKDTNANHQPKSGNWNVVENTNSMIIANNNPAIIETRLTLISS